MLVSQLWPILSVFARKISRRIPESSGELDERILHESAVISCRQLPGNCLTLAKRLVTVPRTHSHEYCFPAPHPVPYCSYRWYPPPPPHRHCWHPRRPGRLCFRRHVLLVGRQQCPVEHHRRGERHQ